MTTETVPLPGAKEPVILLHALTIIHPRVAKTMLVCIKVGGAQLRALLDSGSTHSFVDDATLARASIKLQHHAGL